jgi:hypothetical protein
LRSEPLRCGRVEVQGESKSRSSRPNRFHQEAEKRRERSHVAVKVQNPLESEPEWKKGGMSHTAPGPESQHPLQLYERGDSICRHSTACQDDSDFEWARCIAMPPPTGTYGQALAPGDADIKKLEQSAVVEPLRAFLVRSHSSPPNCRRFQDDLGNASSSM